MSVVLYSSLNIQIRRAVIFKDSEELFARTSRPVKNYSQGHQGNYSTEEYLQHLITYWAGHQS